jgi:hypothetical protein
VPAQSSTLPGPDPLALAFLALAGDGPSLPAQRSLTRYAAAIAASVVLAVGVPAGWLAPSKGTDQPAATLGSSKAVVAAADDDDEPGG